MTAHEAMATGELERENEELKSRLEEAEELLNAIRGGAVDALLVDGPQGAKVYTLQGADQPYRVFVENMNEGAATLAPDGTIVFCNGRFAELAGSPLEQTLSRSLYDFVSAADAAAVVDLLSQANGASDRLEVALGADSNTAVAVRLSARRLSLADGQYICLVATDLRGQKLREKLAEQDRRKDEFLAILGHELRNPLAAIHNAIQVLRRQQPGDPQSPELHRMLEEQTDHMGRMIDDLLDVARLNTGKVRVVLTRQDLVEVVAGAVQACAKDFDANGVSLDVQLPGAPLYIDGDRTRIAQVVGNLLTNANKFTPRGGRVTLALTADASGRNAAIAVRDTGIGMDEATMAQIFEIFSQADRSLERSRGGLGLGLALAKGFVELHGGSVEARSGGLGRGSEFIVRLPIKEEALSGEWRVASPEKAAVNGERRVASKESPVRPPSLPTDHSPRTTRSLRILIVEDNRDGARTMQMLLEMAGHCTEIAADGLAGVEAALRFRPQVVLCDIGLPKIDGYEVARRLRRSDECRAAYLVALSGYGQAEDRRLALEAGFDIHEIKPMPPGRLDEILDRIAAC